MKDTATTEIDTLALHDALPISPKQSPGAQGTVLMTNPPPPAPMPWGGLCPVPPHDKDHVIQPLWQHWLWASIGSEKDRPRNSYKREREASLSQVISVCVTQTLGAKPDPVTVWGPQWTLFICEVLQGPHGWTTPPLFPPPAPPPPLLGLRVLCRSS